MNKYTLEIWLKQVVLIFTFGALGGWLFTLIGLPASWLSGSLIFMACACLYGLPVAFPPILKILAFLTLGVIMGGSVSPDTTARVGAWPLSLLGLLIASYLVPHGVMLYLHKRAGWDKSSSFFAAVPGALSYVVATAIQYENVNHRQVTLFQSVRLIGLVVVLPLIIMAFGWKAPLIPPAVIISWQDALIILIGGYGAGYLFQRLKIPAGMLLGAMIFAAFLYLMGYVRGEFPAWFQAISFMLLSLMIVERFNGATIGELKTIFWPSFNGFILSVAISGVCAIIMAYVLNLPFAQVFLGYAPGGIEAMMILAFVFDLDPAYVGAHHLVRFLAISFFLPLFVRLILKNESKKG